jgi:cobalt-precorrin-5B (C1)-methyltransferase
MELRDPVTALLIPREWIDKSTVPFVELKKLVESGFYAITSSGTLLRRGLSTGTIAAAAAKAAVLSIKEPIREVDILTPVGIRVLVTVEGADGRAIAEKPTSDYHADVTEGLQFEAEATPAKKLILRTGAGIGIVQRRGLQTPIGEAAINPEARNTITRAIKEATGAVGLQGAAITLSARNGETIARKTLNPKIGIVGGISVLGTTGFVEPWNECLVCSMEDLIARADKVVLTTGRTGFKFAHVYFPEYSRILVGNNIDRAVRKARDKDIVILGLPALILKWGNSTILQGSSANTIKELFDANPFGKEVNESLAAIKSRTGAKIVLINSKGEIVRSI